MARVADRRNHPCQRGAARYYVRTAAIADGVLTGVAVTTILAGERGRQPAVNCCPCLRDSQPGVITRRLAFNGSNRPAVLYLSIITWFFVGSPPPAGAVARILLWRL